MMFSGAIAGKVAINIAGIMAKYFATSLAMLKVVISAPRVINNCFPISMISSSFVGLESKSTMLPASLAACVPVFAAITLSTSALRQRRRVICSVPDHRDHSSALLLLPDQRQLVLRLCLRQKIVHARFQRNRRRRQFVVARNHYRLDAHRAQPFKPLRQAALYYVLEINHTQNFVFGGNQQRCSAGKA